MVGIPKFFSADRFLAAANFHDISGTVRGKDFHICPLNHGRRHSVLRLPVRRTVLHRQIRILVAFKDLISGTGFPIAEPVIRRQYQRTLIHQYLPFCLLPGILHLLIVFPVMGTPPVVLHLAPAPVTLIQHRVCTVFLQRLINACPYQHGLGLHCRFPGCSVNLFCQYANGIFIQGHFSDILIQAYRYIGTVSV